MRINVVKNGLLQEQSHVESVRNKALDELRVLKQQLASMEARLREVDMFSQHVAQQAGIELEKTSKDSKFASDIQVDPSEFAQLPLIQSFEQLDKRITQKVKQLSALESVMLGHHIQDISSVAGRPILTGWLSSYYGIRKDPFTGKPAMHKGIDFAGKEGDPVVATAAGLVTWAGERYGYGNLVEIDHGNGLVSRYGHNEGIDVAIGDVVTKGQVIAEMGSTGRSTGAHVHYEVLKKGKQIDPLPFVY